LHSRWYHPPSIHSPGHGQEKKVGWLELFYDLIYVATFIQLGNALSLNLSVTGVLGFAGLLVLLWLTWTAFTDYSNRFDVDDLTHRALVFFQMFCIGGMAISVPKVFDGHTQQFSISYAAVRLVIVVLYARTYWVQKKARDMTGRYTIGYAAGAALWLLSAFLDQPWVHLCWALAAGIDLTLPLSRSIRALVSRYPPDVVHLSERYGLLTLIVLGESFVKVLTSLSEKGAEITHLYTGGMGLVIVCSLWWIYFDDVAGSRIKSNTLAGFAWIYAHMPLTIAIVATGVSIKKAVFFDLSAPAPEGYRWLLCGSLALVLFSVAAIDAVSERRQSEIGDKMRTQTRLASALIVLLLAPTGAFMPAWIFLALMAGCCVTQVVLDLLMAPIHADAEMMHEGAQDVFGTGYDEDEDDDEVVGPPIRRPLSAAIRKGTPSELRGDLYFHFMNGSWWLLFGALLFAFLVTNGIFAALYLLEENAITGGADGSLGDAFSFSVQTMSTIGYGTLSPGTDYANILVTCEAILGIFGTAIATGLMFAKASRPRESILFSAPILITDYHGKRNLMFRVGNARGNEIVEASMSVSALAEETTTEGFKMVRLRDVPLERSKSPLFVLTWQVHHIIDEDSPFYGLTAENIVEKLRGVIVTMTGHDVTYGQTVHGRMMYYPEHFLFDHHFVDVISTLPDGQLLVDYDQFHKTRHNSVLAAGIDPAS
jgi:low temperature requirement protein LtrA